MDAFTDTIRNFGYGGFVWYFYVRDDNFRAYSQYWSIEHCKRFGW